MKPKHACQIESKRSAIIGYGLFQTLVVLVVSVTIGEIFDSGSALVAAIVGLILAGLIAATQALLLSDPDALGSDSEIGAVRRWSSYLTFGLCATVLSALPLWAGIVAFLINATSGAARVVFLLGSVVTMVMLVWWIAWIRSSTLGAPRERQYCRATERLIVGTIASLIVSTLAVLAGCIALKWLPGFPAFWTLAAIPTFSVGLVALGCWLYLRKLVIAREPWYQSHCNVCGYDMAGNLAVSQCPECATPWAAPASPSPGPRAD